MPSFQSPLDAPDSEKPADAEQAVADAQDALGPFTPPADYAFEPEFEPPVPRPISDRIRQGEIDQQRKRAWRGGMSAGLLCLALGELPIVKHWGQFILPLAYLSWIGFGVIVLFAIGSLQRTFAAGNYRYVRDGTPLVARVVALVKAPAVIMNGQAASYAFTATVEVRDPLSGKLRRFELKSRTFTADAKDDHATSFKIGDYVTAVYLPGRFPKSLQLFGFLDLVPGLGMVRRPPIRSPDGVGKACLKAAAFMAIFGTSGWNLYAFRHYHPVDIHYLDAMFAMAIGGAALVVALCGGTWRTHQRQQRRLAEDNLQAVDRGEAVELGAASIWGQRGLYGMAMKVMLVFGAAGIGAMTGLCLCFTANAWLDQSPAALNPVEIDRLKVVTHNFLLREYIVTYSLPGTEKPQEFLTTPERWAALAQRKKALAEVHAGRLGWPWVKAIHPVAMGKVIRL